MTNTNFHFSKLTIVDDNQNYMLSKMILMVVKKFENSWTYKK
jgi:hypothetical protein